MKAYVSDIKWRHHCCDIETSEKFPDTKWFVRPLLIDSARDLCIREEIILGGEKDLKAVFDKFRQHDIVLRANIIGSTPNSIRIVSETKYDGSATKMLMDSGCVLIDACTEDDGWETGTIIGNTRDELKNFYKKLNEAGDAKIVRIGKERAVAPDELGIMKLLSPANTEALSRELSKKQLELFSLAHKRGYYTWPRKITLKEIAGELGLNESTAREHLRRAEAKIMPIIAEVLGKLGPKEGSTES